MSDISMFFTLGQEGAVQAPPVAGRASQAAAQTSTGAESAPIGTVPGGPPPSSNMSPMFMILLFGILIFMIVMSSMSARKEKKKREEMLGSLGRYDRVQTIGGVIGTIVEMRDGEVVLKVDEATNTKISFAKSSIQGVLKKHGEPAKADVPSAEPARA